MEKDHKKMLIGIIVFLILAVIALAGYIVLDKKMKPKQLELNSESIESKEELSDKDINDLLDSLITNDGRASIYFGKKISSEESSKELISFNIYSYIIENNIDLPTGNEPVKISKELINKFINEKYNTTIKYDLSSPDSSAVIDEVGCVSLYNYDTNNWAVSQIQTGCSDMSKNHILVKYEEDGDILYIYSKYVSCFAESGTTCQSDLSSNTNLFTCSVMEEASENCPSELNGSNYKKEIAEYSKYALNNMNDKLTTYKHTFKKVDGKYYWQSSELQTN